MADEVLETVLFSELERIFLGDKEACSMYCSVCYGMIWYLSWKSVKPSFRQR